jgi:hypothetical protein
MTSSSVFRRSLLLALAVGIPAAAIGQTAAPPNAAVYDYHIPVANKPDF